jgi:hypothetical protein
MPRPGTLLLAALAASCLANCSGETSDAPARDPVEDAGGDSTPGKEAGADASGDGEQSCSVTGSYAISGSRDVANPGSCPETLSYPADTVVTVTTGRAGYDVKFAGVPGAASYAYSSYCTANVSGCRITATCRMGIIGDVGPGGSVTSYVNNFTWILGNTGFTGTESWADYTKTQPPCSATWSVTGLRR